MRSRTAWASPTRRRPWSRAAARICSAVAAASARARSPSASSSSRSASADAAHVVDQDLALDASAFDLVLGLAPQLLGVADDLGLPGGGVALDLVDRRPGLGLGLADHAGRRLLGLGADAGRGVPGGLEHPGGLLAQQLDQPVLVELLGEMGPVLGPFGPFVLVGLLALDAAQDLGELVEVRTHLGRVVALADGRELPAGDARRIERGLGRHGPAWYDPNAPRAEGRSDDLCAWPRPGCWKSGRRPHRASPPSRSEMTTGEGGLPPISPTAAPPLTGGRSSMSPPLSASAASASSTVSTATTSRSLPAWSTASW